MGFIDVERIVHRTGRVMRRDIERLEVMVVIFDFRPFNTLKTHRAKKLLHALNGSGNRMQSTDLNTPSRQGDVNRFRRQLCGECR